MQTCINNNNLPIEVKKDTQEDLENIIKIDAGDNTGIALDLDGNVYTWNIGDTAKKVDGLSNIRAISAKNTSFYAINNDGIVYTWGDGKNEIEEIISSLKYIDVNGELLLGEDGRVYKVAEPENPILFLSSICEVSEGEDHSVFRTLEDRVYSIGKGEARTNWKYKNRR